MNLVHHYYIYQSKVRRNDLDISAEPILKKFLYGLVKEIDMEVLIEPSLKFSKNDAWAGLIGIITSHISFHYLANENYLQLDIYSCKEFDIEKTQKFLNNFWNSSNKKLYLLKEIQEKNLKLHKANLK